MNKKYAMIIDGDNMMSCSLPYPLVCPNCKNDFWLIYGVDDLVKLSQKCKCHNQMPQQSSKEPTATEPTATEPTATEPTATEPTATEQKNWSSPKW